MKIQQQVVKYASAHPYLATAVGAGATIACAPAVVTAPFLAVAGFGASGIVPSEYSFSLFFYARLAPRIRQPELR
jgi:hypothetical protein